MYGLSKLREEGGSAVILQVFDSGMFIGYGEGPGAETAARVLMLMAGAARG